MIPEFPQLPERPTRDLGALAPKAYLKAMVQADARSSSIPGAMRPHMNVWSENS
jgi:hypothetical protein